MTTQVVDLPPNVAATVRDLKTLAGRAKGAGRGREEAALAGRQARTWEPRDAPHAPLGGGVEEGHWGDLGGDDEEEDWEGEEEEEEEEERVPTEVSDEEAKGPAGGRGPGGQGGPSGQGLGAVRVEDRDLSCTYRPTPSPTQLVPADWQQSGGPIGPQRPPPLSTQKATRSGGKAAKAAAEARRTASALSAGSMMSAESGQEEPVAVPEAKKGARGRSRRLSVAAASPKGHRAKSRRASVSVAARTAAAGQEAGTRRRGSTGGTSPVPVGALNVEALRKAAEASAAKKKQLNLRTMLRKTGTREDGEEEQPGRGSGEGGEVQS